MNLAPPADLFLRLLGGFAIEVRGRPMPLPVYTKSRLLLAYLALEPDRVHRRERLAGLFWPSLDGTSARANLRLVLNDLRGALGTDHADHLRANRETVALRRDGIAIDARLLFECVEPVDASQCLALAERYSPLLEGSEAGGCSEEFEQWLAAQRERVTQRALSWLRRAIALAQAEGLPGLAAEAARRYTGLAPWDEWGHRVLMEAYGRMGQRAAAQSAFEACRVALAVQLDAMPSEATVELCRRIEGSLSDDALARTLAELIGADRSEPCAPAASLTALMMQTLDRVGGARDPVDWLALAEVPLTTRRLAALAECAESDLQPLLDRLKQGGMIEAGPGGAWRLALPALAQAAAMSLEGPRRRAMHRRLAESGAAEPDRPEWLARQWTGAGEALRAAPLWLAAGEAAFAVGRFAEAARFHAQGIECVAVSHDATTREVARRLALGRAAALAAVHGANAPEASSALRDALELSSPVWESRAKWERGIAEWALSYSLHLLDKAETITAVIGRIVRIVPALSKHGGVLLSFMKAVNAFWKGDTEIAAAGLAACHEDFERMHTADLDGLFFGHSFRLILHCMRSTVTSYVGCHDEALRHGAAALVEAERSGSAAAKGFALVHQPLLHFRRGDAEETGRAAKELAAHAVSLGEIVYLATAIAYLQWARAATDRPWRPADVELATEYIGKVWPVAHPVHLGLLADAHLRAGNREAASDFVAEALRLAKGRHYCMGDLLRLRDRLATPT